jgi:hypothetical protein
VSSKNREANRSSAAGERFKQRLIAFLKKFKKDRGHLKVKVYKKSQIKTREKFHKRRGTRPKKNFEAVAK